MLKSAGKKEPRSIEAKFMAAALYKGAATTTKSRMKSTFNALFVHCKRGRYGEVSPSTLSEKQFIRFVESRIAAGITPRAIQNETSHIRRALIGARRADFAKKMSNAALGVPSGTRIGSGRATDEAVLASALERAAPDTRVWIELERYLGLRQTEVIESHKSIRQWEKAIARGDRFVDVREGTKGGRPRQVFIPDQHRERVLSAVRAGLAVLETRQYMVDATTEQAAKQQMQDRFAALGLRGGDAGHSLRRAFAKDQFEHYMAEGYERRQALSLVSRDMGHGDGRGRWVWNNYLKGSYE